MTTLEINQWCKCGASWKVLSAPPDAAEEMHDTIQALHRGEGHGPATPEEARRARRKAEAGRT